MVQTHRIKILVLLGATGVGKSNKAVECAKKLNGEVISCDSMQIYKGMNIGTGKITQAEMDGIPHHMLDIISPSQSFTAEEYCACVKPIIEDIAGRGKLPIFCGGTGLYISSLLGGATFGAKADLVLRTALKLDTCIIGKTAMYELLSYVDAKAAQSISKNDVKRVTRALEIYFSAGVPKSEAVTFEGSPYDYKIYVLNRDREELYARINARVNQMYHDGLIDEVNSIADVLGAQARQAIGYKEVLENPNLSLEELIELTSRKSRNYAKRQITYFKHMRLEKTFIDADADITKLYTESL